MSTRASSAPLPNGHRAASASPISRGPVSATSLNPRSALRPVPRCVLSRLYPVSERVFTTRPRDDCAYHSLTYFVMTRPKVPDDKRQRTAQACDSCKRRKQKVRCLFDLSYLSSPVLCRPRFERLRYPISFVLLAGSMSAPSHNSSYKHPALGYQIMP